MKILFQENGQTGVFYHRQLVPHVVMTEVLPDITVDRTTSLLSMPDEAIEKYDVIVLHGRVDLKVLQLLSRLRKKYVYDVDDYWYATPDRLFCNEWRLTNHASITEMAIKDAAIVTCTSDILASYTKKHTGVIAHVLPNAIADRDPQFIPNKTESTRLRFGFIGGSSHVGDMDVVGRAIGKLTRNYPQYFDKWQIVYGGFDTDVKSVDTLGRKVSFKQKDYPSIRIEKMLTNNYAICTPEYEGQLTQYTIDPLPSDQNYSRIWAMDVMNYAKQYNYVDVALAPLADNTFNRCKSNLKIVEAGWMDCEVIASYLGTFFDRKTEENISFFSDSDELLRAMVFHIEHFIEHGTPIKMGLPEKIKEHYNAKNFAVKRYELYKTIVWKFHAS